MSINDTRYEQISEVVSAMGGWANFKHWVEESAFKDYKYPTFEDWYEEVFLLADEPESSKDFLPAKFDMVVNQPVAKANGLAR